MDPVSKAKEFIRLNSLLVNGDRVLLSMSAGKDSLFLFNLMKSLAEETGLQVSVFHLNHMRRGDESDREQIYVENTAGSAGCKCYSERYSFPDRETGMGSFEERARDYRYSRLHEIAAENGYTRIVTAHTLDDNVETILMRVFSGTGIHGLSGIPVRRGIIVRPMLEIRSHEIYTFLREKGISWMEDSSNTDSTYSRNYLRAQLIPAILERFPDLFRAVTSLRAVASDSEKIISEYVAFRYPDSSVHDRGSTLIDLDSVKENRAVLNHLLTEAVRQAGSHPSGVMISEINRRLALSASSFTELYSNNRVRIKKISEKGRSLIKIEPFTCNRETRPWEYSIVLSKGVESYFIPETGSRVFFRIFDIEEYPGNEPGITALFSDSGWDSIVLRNRRSGDTLKLDFGTKKIKNLMIDGKVDPELRERVPLLIIDGRTAAYLPGLISGHGNRVSADYSFNNNRKKVLAIWSHKNSD